MKLNTSVALVPCTNGTWVATGEKVIVGGVNTTPKVNPWLAEYATPVGELTSCAEILSVL